MSREGALLVMIAVALVLIGLIAFAWRARTRRDSGHFTAPFGELPEGAASTASFTGFYVATTRHDEPLERLAIRGLAYRSRADVTVADAGVAVDLTGQSRLVIARDSLVAADQSTVAIDRVVEKDGLARLAWRIDADTIVDSYFRPQNASSLALVEAVRGLLAPPSTGDNA